MQGNASFWESAAVALDSLRGSKLRSFLTLLGIILATTTLIAVMSETRRCARVPGLFLPCQPRWNGLRTTREGSAWSRVSSMRSGLGDPGWFADKSFSGRIASLATEQAYQRIV